jgi:hypothetical protein
MDVQQIGHSAVGNILVLCRDRVEIGAYFPHELARSEMNLTPRLGIRSLRWIIKQRGAPEVTRIGEASELISD